MQGTVQQVFLQFTANKPEMDGKTFAKVSKDCHLLDKKLTSTDVDLIFAKIKPTPAARSITYAQFEKGLQMMAEKKGVGIQDVQNQILNAGGPHFQGTKADAVKFHDDKNLYTGVHANGGPSTIDKNHGGLNTICDRSQADVRGVKK
ncbi:unnamed protein product (macronuclear) [Paramecium tetraurelia]|uniref:P25-alpha family protein n=2 Tax=Paramecium TaxID=5884 RepID=A0BD86_PARTE|nr:uncharacterized protein GSPATT00004597001 [Paramecium tetraurelia]CAD8138555.1 unnamed protein product [Paramecium octaurelia]CAK56503.1 unnamed protein product [Paramecium tetraurelia]|eukprot:XP_001423901.1 hypothetical protein (macronuclear) [Paramecium tetraurelia strain d4-2]